MTLVLKFDLDMVKMYLYVENKFPSYSRSKVIARTDKHSDLTEIITYPHTLMVTRLYAHQIYT